MAIGGGGGGRPACERRWGKVEVGGRGVGGDGGRWRWAAGVWAVEEGGMRRRWRWAEVGGGGEGRRGEAATG